MHGGFTVDATIIVPLSSKKNKDDKDNPEMHQTKKVNQYHHSMKVMPEQISEVGYIHAVIGIAANNYDAEGVVNHLRKDDEVCHGDFGFIGVEKWHETQNKECYVKLYLVQMQDISA